MPNLVRLGVYIDCNNLWHSAQRYIANELGGDRERFLSYSMLADLIKFNPSNHAFVICRAYVVQGGSPGEDRFRKMLEHKGFEVKSKSMTGVPSGLRGSDWDAGITADIMSECGQWDALCLFGGDSDYTHAAEFVKNQGKEFMLFSFLGSTSRMLIDMADVFVELVEPNSIGRKGGHGD